MGRKKICWQPFVALALTVLFFVVLFFADNKYQTPPPYGKSGVLTLEEKDLERGNPVFLIDGWLLSDGRVKDRPTYIGEFSSLQRGDAAVSPHGKARYELTLHYEGTSRTVAADFPQLAFSYAIFLDGTCLAQGTGNGRAVFLLNPGDHVLAVETSSASGYYSGMYFPPAFGTAETLWKVGSIQEVAYASVFLLPLSLAVFTLFLWRSGGDLSRWFGLLCLFYALYLFRYFVFLFSMPVAQYWFLVQNMALYGLCFSVMQLTVLASGADKSSVWRYMSAVMLALPAALVVLCLLIPAVPWAVLAHGRLTDAYYLVTFCGSVFFTVRGMKTPGWENRYTLSGGLVFGAGLFVNLFFSNRFEPIRFFWQFEWCGLGLVLLFGAMMISRSRRMVKENEELTNHLEELVEKRTREVTQLLEERKAFFSDMAHDLKAPVFATRSFIQAIRKSGVGVDPELSGYLDQAEAKQWEMARRLQGLSALNALDRIEGEKVRISMAKLLLELYGTYHEETKVRSVYFFVEPPVPDAFLTAQPEKLDLLFENLIYNALKATPAGGRITVQAHGEDGNLCIVVEDTGCGIPEEELPYIFHRFYVGKRNKDTGTGLGLYIVHSIVTELGGTINVQSTVGSGTRFILEFSQDISMPV